MRHTTIKELTDDDIVTSLAGDDVTVTSESFQQQQQRHLAVNVESRDDLNELMTGMHDKETNIHGICYAVTQSPFATSRGRGAGYWNERVCLSVRQCLLVCHRYHTAELHQIFTYVRCGRAWLGMAYSSSGVAICHALPFCGCQWDFMSWAVWHVRHVWRIA